MTTAKSTGIGWLLGIVFGALPWLVPVHGDPWTTFYGEVWAAAMVLPVAAWVLLRKRGAWALDAGPAVLLSLVCAPLVQAAAGMYVFSGEARLVALYLAAIALTIVIARAAQESEPLCLADALFAAILIASLMSVMLALHQWFQLDWFGVLSAGPMLEGRAAANLGQPNNLATLLCWGLIAIWWSHARGKVSARGALAGAGFLLVGIALTRSRTGWLEVALIAAAALYQRRRAAAAPAPRAVIALVAGFALLVVGLDVAGALLQQPSSDTSVRDQMSVGRRPAIWMLAVEAIAQRPWFGYGWNQGVLAHMANADRFPDLRTIVQHAHSLPLDLLLWNGVPIGLALLAALAAWAIVQLRSCRTAPQRLLLLSLAVLLVHACLELPHTYLFFLLPAALMVGTLDALRTSTALVQVPRAAVAAVVAAAALLIGLAIRDYGHIESNLQSARIKAAHVHSAHPVPRHEPLMLTHLQTAIDALYAVPQKGMSAEAVELMRRALDRHPSMGGLMRYAQATALRGDPHGARWALQRICLLYNTRQCEDALKEWRDLALGSPEMALVVPPTAR